MPFDFKKEYRELYVPAEKSKIITVPRMRFAAVRGAGDPNAEGGAYQQAVAILYAVSYALKTSWKKGREIEGFYDYVVPPLEGFWQQDGAADVDYSRKESFRWITVIRLPDFVTEDHFAWAVEAAAQKKKLDCSAAELWSLEEGLCVQMMHRGPFEREPATVAVMDAYLREKGYENDFSDCRLHHELYLSDPRKVPPEKWRIVIRHPIRRCSHQNTGVSRSSKANTA